MTNLQFILLLKEGFSEYFKAKIDGKHLSLMTIDEIIREYKKSIEKQAIQKYKKQQNELNNDKK